jgi:hypothetical protein
MTNSPIGPAPTTSAESAGVTALSDTAWIAQAAGSAIDASRSVRVSGIGSTDAAGIRTYSAFPPGNAAPSSRRVRQRWLRVVTQY